MPLNDGPSRTTFLAFQSPGALSNGAFRELELEANGAGPAAHNSAQAVIAARANPAAKEITGSATSLANGLANSSGAKGNSASNDDTRGGARRGGELRSIDIALYAQQQGVGWAKEKPELMKLGTQAIQGPSPMPNLQRPASSDWKRMRASPQATWSTSRNSRRRRTSTRTG